LVFFVFALPSRSPAGIKKATLFGWRQIMSPESGRTAARIVEPDHPLSREGSSA